MPSIITPYIPQNITVHLGAPDASAANVTVPFADYVKNVASSEIYPTWDESALRANILAITSFALNRVYTEFYRSRGYDFDITSSTAYDQKFINGRNIFENISELVDDLFNDYLRRQGVAEPLAAKFCNGTTVTCEGLSQWGSEYLARQGYSSVDILRNYYGNDIQIVTDAPVQAITSSYPGTALRRGSSGGDVATIQIALNRISQNYPAIPKVDVDGVFGSRTEEAVQIFQRIFGLDPDGVVGRATWYAIVRTYVAVNALSELQSLGQTYFTRYSFQYPNGLSEGDRGENVTNLQYMLAVISSFVPQVPPVNIDGIFGTRTGDAVAAFQRFASLPITRVVNAETWDAIYEEYAGIEATVFDSEALFPADTDLTPQQIQAILDRWRTEGIGSVPAMATSQGAQTDYSKTTQFRQHPASTLQRGSRDNQEVRV